MRSVSNAFKQALEDGNRNYQCNVYITLADNTQVTLTNANLLINGLSINDSISSDSDFTALGSVIVNAVEIRSNNLSGTYSEYDFIDGIATVHIGLTIGTTIESIKIGTYVINDASFKKSVLSLYCLDYLSKFDKPYSNSVLVYPATLATILSGACTDCGVTLYSTVFPNSTLSIPTAPQGDLTYREVISYIATIAGCFVKCNANGQLVLQWFDFNAEHSLSALASYDYSTTDITITGIKIITQTTAEAETTEVEHLFGEDGYIITIENNPFITETNVTTIGDYLESQIVGLTFRAGTTLHLSDPTIEAGDTAVVIDRHSNTYNILVTNTTFNVSSYQEIKCSAQEPTTKTAVRFTETQKTYTATKQLIQQEKAARQQLGQELSSAINAKAGMYETRVQESGGGYTYYLHDKPLLANSTAVIKITNEAVGVTADYQASPPVWYGLTVDGNFIANIMSVIGIDFDWGTGGTLTLGGANNINGSLTILDANGNTIGTWNNGGIDTIKGTIGPWTLSGTALTGGTLNIECDGSYYGSTITIKVSETTSENKDVRTTMYGDGYHIFTKAHASLNNYSIGALAAHTVNNGDPNDEERYTYVNLSRYDVSDQAIGGGTLRAVEDGLEIQTYRGATTQFTSNGIDTNGIITSATWNGDTITVGYGGTGATSFTSGAALIGNGTNAITTRSITNNTSKQSVTANTNLITANTLAYWSGAYNSSGASNISYLGTITSGTWHGSTIGVEYGGTGATSLTSGAALIGNGTGAIGTRSITNNTSKTYIAYNTNLMTTNTLAYWDGSYNSSGNSNISYLADGCRANGAFWVWGNVYSKMSNYTRGTAPSSAIYRGFEFKDSADTRLGIFEVGELANGNAVLNMYLSTPDGYTGNNQSGIVLTKTPAGVLTCAIAGNTTVTGSISSYINSATSTTVSARNSVGHVQLYMASNGNMGVYSATDSKYLIYKDSNGQGYIGFPIQLTGVLQTSGNINIYNNSANSYAVGVQNSKGKVQLYMSSDGRMGVYDATNSRWLVYEDTSGYINMPRVYANTTTSAVNVVCLTSSGTMHRYSSSSKRYKHSITPLTDWKRILDIPVVSFIYNKGYISDKDQRFGQRIPGFIAEDVDTYYPIAVEKQEGRIEDWNIRYIVPPMLAVEQDHEKRINELETEINELKQIIKKLVDMQ